MGEPLPPAPATAVGHHPDGSAPWYLWICCAFLLLATTLAFLPVLDAGFVRWDDQYYVEDNPLLRDADGLKKIWNPLARSTPQFYPLTFSSFWLQYRLWGLDPHGYHAVNFALHLLNVFLVVLLLCRLGAHPWVVGGAAAIFALHPVQVATVAWVSELKNTLSTNFYLGAFLLYLRHRRTGHWAPYAAALFAFVGALLSKAETITLPVSLAFADGLLQDRIGRSSVRAVAARIAPMLGLAVASMLLTLMFEQRPWTRTFTVAERVLIAANAAWFYVRTFLAPFSLAPLYPEWQVTVSDPSWWIAVVAWVAVFILVTWRWRRVDRLIVWGAAHFLIALAPMLGLVSFNYQTYAFVADHYLYLSSIGGGLAVIVTLEHCGREWTHWSMRQAVVVGVSLLMLVTCGVQTHLEALNWRTNELFWMHVIERNPNGFVGNYNLGNHYRATREWRRAALFYQRAVEARPGADYAFRRYVQALGQAEGPQAAIAACDTKLASVPAFYPAFLERGLYQEQLGKRAEALRDYTLAVDLSPPGSPLWNQARQRRDELRRQLAARG